MKHAVSLATLMLAASAHVSTHAAEGYATWDNFDGATEINATRWLGTERTRLVESGKLHFVQRDLGSQTSNSGLFSNSWGDNVTNPAAVTQMRAQVTVDAFEVTGCAANPSASGVQARLVGGFFNAGPGLATSRINDVGATIRLERYSNSVDAAGVLRVTGTVFQCTTTDCNSGTADLGTVDLGTAALGETVTLKMEWEPLSKRFNFYRGSNPVARVTYTANDSQPAFLVFRQLGTRTHAANCLTGNRPEAFIDARLGNFSVNTSAAP